jgi:hypothetical protein
MTAPYRVNIDIATNEDLRQPFALTDGVDQPIDITGATIEMEIEQIDGPDRLELTTANTRIVVLDAAAGEFEIAVPAAVIVVLTPGVYRHDLVLKQAGRAQRIFEGTLTLSRGVTR